MVTKDAFYRRPLVVALLLGVLLGSAVALLKYLGWLQPMELSAYDFLVRIRPTEPSIEHRIVLFEITERDIRDLGYWPLTDAALADILHQLLSLQPEVIGVDIYRDAPVPPGTNTLRTALLRNSQVIVVSKFGTTVGTSILPPQYMEGTEQVGFADMPVDIDGVVRKGLLFLDDGQQVFYSLSLRMALNFLASQQIYPAPGRSDAAHLRLGNISIRPIESGDGGYVRADARGYQFMLDFRGGAKPFSTFSLGELKRGEIQSQHIAGKIVLIGVSASSVKDNFVTPYRESVDHTVAMPGMVLHAHATSQLLRHAMDNQQSLEVPAGALAIAWLFLWSTLGNLVGLLVRSLGWFLVAISIGLGILFISAYVAFLNDWWIPLIPPVVAWLLSSSLMAAYLSGHETKQKKKVMDLFSRHVSPQVAQEIWAHWDQLGVAGRLPTRAASVTVMFSDLEDFTPLSESLAPERLMKWLNEYTEVMANIVMLHDGFVDDYYGDAIKANFGVPMIKEGQAERVIHALNAVRCALAMCDAMNRLNEQWQTRGLPIIRLRIGVATGKVVAGCIGSAERMKYTTVGDTVNIAARLESYDKQMTGLSQSGHCRILIDELTAQLVESEFKSALIGSVALKGKSAFVNIYRLVTA